MEKNALKEQSHEVEFDWDGFMKFLLETPGELKKVHFAWPLFCDIARNIDHAGLYTNTYTKLAQRYGVAPGTVKKWRKHLFRNLVIESYSRGHSVAFRLLRPYQDFVKKNTEDFNKQSRRENLETEGLAALRELLLQTIQNKDPIK